MQDVYNSKKHMADLGCGSGILSIIMKENAGFEGSITCLDTSENALECAKMNLQLYGKVEEDGLELKEVDLVDLWFPISGSPEATKSQKQVNFYDKISEDLGFPQKFDLITCNPPWIPASYITGNQSSMTHNFDLDNAVYDPKEKFLISCLNFAKFHLDPDNGEMLLVYSDLAVNLGLQEPNRIHDLASKFGFCKVTLIDQTSMPLTKNLHDPLKMIKK